MSVSSVMGLFDGREPLCGYCLLDYSGFRRSEAKLDMVKRATDQVLHVCTVSYGLRVTGMAGRWQAGIGNSHVDGGEAL